MQFASLPDSECKKPNRYIYFFLVFVVKFKIKNAQLKIRYFVYKYSNCYRLVRWGRTSVLFQNLFPAWTRNKLFSLLRQIKHINQAMSCHWIINISPWKKSIFIRMIYWPQKNAKTKCLLPSAAHQSSAVGLARKTALQRVLGVHQNRLKPHSHTGVQIWVCLCVCVWGSEVNL